MKIGFTEQGDAGLNFSWARNLALVDGAVLITKSCNDAFIDRVLEAQKKDTPFLIHIGCTGWGNSRIEPNVPSYDDQIKQTKKLMEAGFPKEKLVFRIDPIWPTPNGVRRVLDVLKEADHILGLSDMRIRISILDEYKHVKERMINAGWARPLYGPTSLYPMRDKIRLVGKALEETGYTFECCAEPALTEPCFIHHGCLSETDLKLMGLSIDRTVTVNPQHRNSCKCLGYKVELLNGEKKRCPNGCIYCYWKD